MAWAAAGRVMRPVAEAEARERAFTCTASHDLVTPLMAVTANGPRKRCTGVISSRAAASIASGAAEGPQ